MASITSKVQICNMALTHLGNYGSVNNIDSPRNSAETSFALWYDITREYVLRLTMPNFALERRIVAQKSTAPDFGYGFAYEYPSDCLKVLGFGNIDQKDKEYTIEGSDILMNEDFTTGLKLRFIKNITDVGLFSADFVILLSWYLAAHTALDITQSQEKRAEITNMLPGKLLELSGISAQENPPIRKSDSKFKQARYSNPTRNNQKR